jgi:hypothetical protein
MPKPTGEIASARFWIRDMGKKKAPERVILRSQFLDDQGVGQGGSFAK